jgi:hypothetical protein
MEFRTLSGDMFGFTAFDKFLERIRPYRLEQSPATGRFRSIQCDKRLGNQTCDLIEDNGRGATLVAHYGVRSFEREPTGENTQPAQQASFRLRQQFIAPVECRAQGLMPP